MHERQPPRCPATGFSTACIGSALAALVALPACGQVEGATLGVGPARESFQPTEAFAGYTLFAPLRSTTTYLVDMQGEPVHQWESDFKPTSVYLLDDGSLLRSSKEPDPPTFEGGGQCGRIQRIEWNGDVVWNYLYSTEDHLQHHDIELLPNGNVVFIAWERKTRDEAIAAGRNPEYLEWDTFWPGMLIEVRPVPPAGGEIVWEWHAWDHLVQDFDANAPDYADPSKHPERIDVNGDQRTPREKLTPEEENAELDRLAALGYAGDDDHDDDTADGDHEETETEEEAAKKKEERRRRSADWLHTNAVDYHAGMDLIAISARRFHEVWVIDHSTTTEEARGSKGGRFGKGGDLVYRWGNPLVYGMGTPEDRILFGQHDVQWIPDGYLGAGNFLLFNNGSEKGGRAWSSVDEFRMPMDARGTIKRRAGRPFGPSAPLWRYKADSAEEFFSSFISGAQRLPNGNTLICSGEHGRVFEVTPAGETVWTFENPYGDEPDPEESHPEPRTALFRATRIAPDHPGLARLQRP